ncbi:MAG: geranylgeranylglyceryl/heptaprenylglyceryl phosphate synthase [Candidatus Methanomethylicia archaeon]|nr:geranylgeranylglyceryl/heptaprenylglyceryl phosphate synthase [Candidatus Methanomethylicia archaeon]MCX8169130.1 geranylgeranylglyceryl/heptaprenylglyceryl phosphate synthase [Candidatus Methanomethylicia archaeon]MDW7988862.1 geranylgeranylglyceryl/heptaprenylglyceryl phosphate synthase [Nitrososphaerota archaeon]
MSLGIGKVEAYLLERIKNEGAIHITLIDPEKVNDTVIDRVVNAVKAGSAAIMIGGSTGVTETVLDNVILNVKERVKEVPIILFPGNITGISRCADAIWFMSLLNSSNTYYIIEAQTQGAIIIKKYNIEAIPMGYIILGKGGLAGYIGHAKLIPYDYPELAAMYALAGSYLGMRFIYLEAGSGTDEPIPPKVVRTVRNVTKSRIIVGGGIRTAHQAVSIVEAGADIIVTGTLIEEDKGHEKIKEIINAIRSRSTKTNSYL